MTPPAPKVRFTIDGAVLEASGSRTVLDVALERGIAIPYFCYHPYLSVPGNCRQCQVRVGMAKPGEPVKWMPKLAVSCNTQIAEGMVVDTASEEVRRAQAANMEFLLINHPLDCPICDQVGECWLQEHAFTAGPGQTRYREEKVHMDKRVDIGPHVLLDKERCIQCTRCIRFCDEITHTSELALFSRTNHTEVDIFPGRPLDNAYSGNVVDICPVGALTLKEFRFKSRLWFLQAESSVCPGCARGCNIKVWHRDRAISRITPRDNPAVNDSWICDEGRLIGESLAAQERVREPRADGRPVGWDEALAETARILKEAKGVAGVLGGWATQEEGYLVLRLLEYLDGAARVAVPEETRGSDDDLLIRADKTPNRRGLLEMIDPSAVGGPGKAPRPRRELVPLLRLLEDGGAGKVGALIVCGAGMNGGAVPADLLARAVDKGMALVALAAHESEATRLARIVLPAAVFPEVEGTVVNFEGRVQIQKGTYAPPFMSRTGVRILRDLAGLAGAGEPPESIADLFDEMARQEPSFHGLTRAALGAGGALLPAGAMGEAR
jgi:NADH-quinone oxidoreductase subunit G